MKKKEDSNDVYSYKNESGDMKQSELTKPTRWEWMVDFECINCKKTNAHVYININDLNRVHYFETTVHGTDHSNKVTMMGKSVSCKYCKLTNYIVPGI